MSLKDSGHHFIAIFGGAVAGAEAAHQLSKRGFRVVIFDQALLPYGKIEDGLPKWHAKLRDKEEANIDMKINQPNIRFVPGARLGRDVDFEEILTWGFSAIILATGAWKDRPLPVEGVDEFVDKGLYYQNSFVHWFNHKHEPAYSGPRFEIMDNAIVVGGGLASLDVVKILMIETVQKALQQRGIDVDMFRLEHGINKVLDQHDLSLSDLGLKGCTLFYRRRAIDMPLSPMATDTPEKLEKAQTVRQKILDNFQRKYLFRFRPCCVPVERISKNGRLSGLKFQRTRVEGNKVVGTDEFLEVHTPLVISSIGSIPEMIKGIPSDGNTFSISDTGSCQIDGFDHVFAIGNAVTGKGNINESIKHGKEISEEIMDNFLVWHQEDYENWHRQTAAKVDRDIAKIVAVIEKRKFMPDDVIQSILDKTKKLQENAGFDGDYESWVKRNTPPRLENLPD
ncbi:MAG: FAD-dependent oxidoreductase [Cytophagales bacterium]|nr:FAD-dependent oxidoreductase [Cytophagales bacterium]